MQVIQKHVLCVIDDACHGLAKTFKMCPHADVIKVAKRESTIILWDHYSAYYHATENRSFIILETSKPFSEMVRYIDTIFDGPRELHVCEVIS